MRYWWVNQKQTFRHEIAGGYLWSPKKKRNGHQNPFYDFMRVVSPGDAILSFANATIRAVGLARSHSYEAPKPLEFGKAGAHWDQIGWRVDVAFVQLSHAVRPATYIDRIRPLLPSRYSPLLADGRGSQSVYLTTLSADLAGMLIDLMGAEARAALSGRVLLDAPQTPAAIGLEEWEEHELSLVRGSLSLEPTVRQALVMARRGQGLFKSRVSLIEKACRITKVKREEHLIASHCKPWRDSTNEERLDGENGLLLTPNADHLFDRGFIGFEDNGDVLVSPVAHRESLLKLGIDPDRSLNVGAFSKGQQRYLEFHRNAVLLKSKYLDG
jgi:putative restriction endonuclease